MERGPRALALQHQGRPRAFRTRGAAGASAPQAGPAPLLAREQPAQPAHGAGDLLDGDPHRPARPVDHAVPGDLFPRLWHPAREALRLHRCRPPSPGLPEWDREAELRVLRLRQRRVRLCQGSGRTYRAILVSDSPRQTRARAARPLPELRGLRRRRRLSQTAAAAAKAIAR